ncbi:MULTISPECIES: ABC transporter permease [Embleya]|uniref:Putative dipeptide-transport integral membrane protein ABC transporter DppB n=1 Tax=Embleya hyalina TaxID=516124 RepID=A0A401Z175_9ACTN|nr:ABC transporter permease [Embleya hyalina]GCE00650.1 putative dipeptide-transport integral membrane protein ABC transporter DppB [Embleya hyalina]
MRTRATASLVVSRILVYAGMLVLISFVIFSLLYITPGDAVGNLLGTRRRTPETEELLRRQYHLNEPFLTQYWIWLKDAVRFDFGNSSVSTLPVTDEINARLPNSLILAGVAYVLTMLIGIPLGLAAAAKKSTAVDRGIVASVIVGFSTPVFVGAVALLYVFGVLLGWFPVFGAGTGFVDKLWHLTLPAISLAIAGAGLIVKHTRAVMIKVLDQDYVTFARARGLTSRRVYLLYALRNGLIPVITVSVPLLASLVTGAVLVEVTFSIPGIGDLLVRSAASQDLPTLQAIALLVAALIMVANLAADLLYMAADPRIRHGRSTT